MNTDIENFIIDFGGVLFEIDIPRTRNAFREISDFQITENDEQNIARDTIYKFEKGMFGEDHFRKEMKKRLGVNVDDNKFDEIWNLTLVGIYPKSLSIIKSLKKLGKLFLLSNTNIIHKRFFSKQCSEMLSLFDKTYYSHLIGKIKPEHDAFEFVINENNLDKQKTLFIDDRIENIEAAASIGIRTFYIQKEGNLSELLHSVNINTQEL